MSVSDRRQELLAFGESDSGVIIAQLTYMITSTVEVRKMRRR